MTTVMTEIGILRQMKYNLPPLHELIGNDQICGPAYCGKKLLQVLKSILFGHMSCFIVILRQA